MRALPFFLLAQLKRTRIRYPLPSITHSRTLHGSPASSYPSVGPSSPSPSPSQLLHAPPDRTPRPDPESDAEAPMNEFLSRFVHSIRPILAQSFPDLNKQTLDSMLLLICQRVVAEIDQTEPPAAVDLSEDLWNMIQEVSTSVHESMRRDRMRGELKKYLHHEDVKDMCRFAGDVGIRGDMLREFRFKWAREKLEEDEFYRNLEKIRENAEKGEEEGEKKVKVESLPERKGNIKYKIYGLDLSDTKWAEVAGGVEEAESKFVKEEAKLVVGRSKRLEEKFFGLDWEKDELMPVLKEWAEALEAKRVDWLALLERIKEKNLDTYLKVAELLLSEESFEPNIRDYSKLIDAHSKADRLEDAERILTKMNDNGIRPDVLTSNILLHMYCKAGDLDRAKELFESLKKEGFQVDLKAYMSLITAYVKAGRTKEAEALAHEMEEKKNIKPTEENYMELLRAFAEQGQVDGAQKIMHRMFFAGIQYTLEAYSLLIGAYAQAGDSVQTRAQFDHMRRSGIKPDDRCTASMMTAYLKQNLLDQALELLLSLKKEDFEPGIATKTAMVDWFSRLLLVEEAEQVLVEIKTMGELPFEVHVSLCDMYARAGDQQKARKSLKILEGRKELLRKDQFERIVGALVKHNMVEDGKRMYEAMQSLGHNPSEALRVQFMSAQTFSRPMPAQTFSRRMPGRR